MENRERNQTILQLACEFLEQLGIVPSEAYAEDTGEEGQVLVSLVVENPGRLIGFKGRTLSSYQLLLALVVKNALATPVQVLVDVNNYRDSQKTRLKQMVEEAAARVAEHGSPVALPSMTPFERRLCHMFVSEMEGYRSESEGEGESRHLVIYSAT